MSPIIDCFDRLVVYWNAETRPTAELVNDLLDDAIGSLHSKEHPIVHSDRGLIIDGLAGLVECVMLN
ncbi:MAG: putative transposase [Halioglobus sp.]